MKAAKVAARVPLALVSVGNSEIVYHCARGLDAGPPSFAVDEQDAVPGQAEERLEKWPRLTPEERLKKCWEQVQADWAASNSAFSNPAARGWMDPSTHAEHHRHGHHHHRGC